MTDWYTPSTAKSELAIVVSTHQLQVAREELLNRKGLPLDLTNPPTLSFAAGVVHQALANQQAASANPSDELGGESNGVRLYPFDRKIMAMLVVPDSWVPPATRDTSFVRSLIG